MVELYHEKWYSEKYHNTLVNVPMIQGVIFYSGEKERIAREKQTKNENEMGKERKEGGGKEV